MDITCTECINAEQTTYFKPTDCDLCGKLLWGIYNQGYMCQECNKSYHKACVEIKYLQIKCLQIQTSENEDNTTKKDITTNIITNITANITTNITTKKDITTKCEIQIPKSADHEMRLSDIRRGNKGINYTVE